MNFENFITSDFDRVQLLPTVFNFVVCMIMSFVIRDFYIKRSFSLTGKLHVGTIIPLLSAIVFLVIVVVKSSLALSLGLVGALSIVRFRTPIKEPEELVYLFFAIAIGLGYAAGQTAITTIIGLSIIAVVFFFLSNKQISNTGDYNIVVEWQSKRASFEQISSAINPLVTSMRLLRLDADVDTSSAVMLVVPNDGQSIDAVMNEMKKIDPEVHISFFEAKTNW